ncbi:MAG TPA: hypothetical protein VG759_01015 [Candidatus Angelobacter sp.]|nr:hypothetical protein [Candidatus Angelobacter sp.]
MNHWRMSFRAGNHGHEMWPECVRLGVAAITYYPLERTDLSRYPESEPRRLWKQLAVSQKVSLRRVAYEMQGGDIIYVKQGPKIVGKGTIQGALNQRAYKFDSRFQITDPQGVPWAHQVPVDWSGDFPQIDMLLGSEQYTVKELSEQEVARIDQVAGRTAAQSISQVPARQAELLSEEVYYRETPAMRKVITPRHNGLSNEFRRWLARQYGINAIQERERIDIRFAWKEQSVLVELKVCFGVGTTKSIREALGQVLEYTHYPKRKSAENWLIVLDEEPSSGDKYFIERLRAECLLPLFIGWRTSSGFSFDPAWPCF